MINEIFSSINKIHFGVDGDVVDRLHHKYTVFLLIFFALFLTTETICGERIKCLIGPENPKPWGAYINRLCWVKNTYYADLDDLVEVQREAQDVDHIMYYQWAALVLTLSAVMFYLPCNLWHYFAGKAGIDMDKMITTCTNFDHIGDDEKRTKTFKNLAEFMDRFLDAQAEGMKKRKGKPLLRMFNMCSRDSGNYLGFGYLVTKVVYLLNVLFQFTMMKEFLGPNVGFFTFGLDAHKFKSEGMVWENQSRFPRVVMCDYKVRTLGDVENTLTTQCLLPQNIFMEKVFLIVWWWYSALLVLTVLNILQWTIRIYAGLDAKSYIKKFLLANEKYDGKNKKQLSNFVRHYLMKDGVFVVRIIARNVSALVMSDIVGEIWTHFVENYEEEMRQRGLATDDQVPLTGDDGSDDVHPPPYDEAPSAPSKAEFIDEQRPTEE
jgi:hypothetical protein